MPIKDVMAVFKHPQAKVSYASGRKVDYIPSRKISVPVNKENVLKYGIVEEKYADMIPDEIVLEMSADKDYLTKPELFLLDFLSNYQWDRPLATLNFGGDLNVGIKDYLEFDGFSYKLIPIKNKPSSSKPGFVETDELYRLLTEVYKFDALSADKWFVDYQNYYTFLGVMSIRGMFSTAATAFMEAGENDRAEEMIDKGLQVMHRFPLSAGAIGLSGNDYMVVNMIDQYYKLGKTEKAQDLAVKMSNELLTNARFFLEFYEWGKDDFDLAANYLYLLADVLKRNGDKEIADQISDSFNGMLDSAMGNK